MDNKTLDLTTFIKSLTAEQADACESDENQLAEIFREGWSEANAVCFHRTMLNARRVDPDITVEGVFEVAFKHGLECVSALLSPKVALAKPTRRKKLQRGARVMGVPGRGVVVREA
jgi:hypothetical protein